MKKNNKVVMLGHKRIPSREGGVEIVVEELATRMVRKGMDVIAYNRSGNHVSNDTATTKITCHNNVNIQWIFTINKKGLDALVYSFFASVKAAFSSAKVIHYHAEGSCGMLWIPKLFRKRIIVTVHGLDWQRAKWGGFATKYILFSEKVAVRYADEIIVLSKGVQEYFLSTYNRKTIYIPNGVNHPKAKDSNVINKKYGLIGDDYILFLARIVPEKGLHYLIDAYKKLNTPKKLVIAGGSSHTNDYLDEILNKTSSNENIILTGFVDGDELIELYSNAFLYVLPSDIEGLPLSLLEAMSYGLPCLVSDIKENTDVIKEFGFSFEKGNVQSLVQELNKILQSTNLKETGNKAKESVLKEYNWDEIVEKTMKLY